MVAMTIAALVLGGLSTAFGAAVTLKQRGKIARCTLPVRAEIIANQRVYDNIGQNGCGPKGYAPVYAYEVDGTRYPTPGKFPHALPLADVGQEVDILVDPANPKAIYEPRHERAANTVAALFLLAGIAMDVLAIGLVAANWPR